MPEGKKPSGKLTPKQRKALEYLQQAIMGEMSVEEALKKAGYSDKTARQQKSVIDSLRHNSAIQEAMEKAEIDDAMLVGKLRTGLDAEANDTMFKFLKLAFELKDAFPANKNINADVGVETLLDEAENGADYAEWDSENKEKTDEDRARE